SSRISNGVTRAFSVDNRNQLTRISNPVVIPSYDTNGNLIKQDSKVTYAYDDENRLVEWAHYAVNSANPSDGDKLTDFVYDGLGRLRKRLEYHYVNPGSSPLGLPLAPSSNWTLDSETHYVYDGRRVIQERN